MITPAQIAILGGVILTCCGALYLVFFRDQGDKVPVLLWDPSGPKIAVKDLPLDEDNARLVCKDVDGFPDQDIALKDGFAHEIRDRSKKERRIGYVVDAQTGQLVIWPGREKSLEMYQEAMEQDRPDVDVGGPLRVNGQVLQDAKESHTLQNLLNFLGGRSELMQILHEYQPVFTLLSVVLLGAVLLIVTRQFGVI